MSRRKAPVGECTGVIDYDNACCADQSAAWTVKLIINGEDSALSAAVGSSE
ncbi:hypothetical protein J7J63_00130 [Candidatus Bipolaricaulota bacterium]|nr:hypothetical protein [Candidatus Bipolaricaulota bacterium]